MTPTDNQSPRWYCLNAIGMATLCSSEDDARLEASNADSLYPRHAPHRAVQLVELFSESLLVQQAEALRLMRDAFLDSSGTHGAQEVAATEAADAALAAYESAITPKSVAGGEAGAAGITGGNGGVPDDAHILNFLVPWVISDDEQDRRDFTAAVRAMLAATPAPQPVALVPLHINELAAWLTVRYRAAGGKEGITDLSAFCEEVMRWTEAKHGIGLTMAGGEG